MKIFKQIDLCFIFQPQKPKVQSCFLNHQDLKQGSSKIQWNTLFIRIWDFRSIRSILVYSVKKSKDCNMSGEALSTSYLERLSLFIISTTPVESLVTVWKRYQVPKAKIQTRTREQNGNDSTGATWTPKMPLKPTWFTKLIHHLLLLSNLLYRVRSSACRFPITIFREWQEKHEFRKTTETLHDFAIDAQHLLLSDHFYRVRPLTSTFPICMNFPRITGKQNKKSGLACFYHIHIGHIFVETKCRGIQRWGWWWWGWGTF